MFCHPLLFVVHFNSLVGLMDITVAYFHPFLHPEIVKRDFEQIRAMGAGSVVCAIHEQEEQRWSRDLERGLSAGARCRLKGLS